MVAALEDHHETVGLRALGELLGDAAALGDGDVAELLFQSLSATTSSLVAREK